MNYTFEQYLDWTERIISYEWRQYVELSIPREKTYTRRSLFEWTLMIPPSTNPQTLVKN